MKKIRGWLYTAVLFSSMASLSGQTTYNQVIKKVASDRAINDMFGYSVSVDGDYAVVGAPNHTHGVSACGSVYIFQRDVSGIWNQVQEIYAADRQANDHFGWSVGISGSYLIVGAPDHDLNADGLYPMTNSGAVYLYKNNGVSWVLESKVVGGDRETGDQLGWSVSIFNTTAVAGAPYQEDPGGTNDGAVYIMSRSGAGIWSVANIVKATDKEAEDHLGYSVWINNSEVVAGAPDEDINGSSLNAGAVYTFMRSSGVWVQTQKVIPTIRRAGDRFGFSVSKYGSTLVVGAPYHDYNADDSGSNTDGGAAFVFNKSGTWTQSQKLVPSDRLSNDHFGWSVCKNINDIVVGSPDDDQTNPISLSNQGSVYVFNTKGDLKWAQTQHLKASDRAGLDNFGISVAVSNTKIFIGANNEDENASNAATLSSAGSAYVFEGCAYSVSSFTTAASGCIGEDLMINALVNFSDTYRWQIQYGASYRDIDPLFDQTDSIYNGYTTPFLTINNVAYCLNGYKYRCKITSSCGAISYINYELTVDPASFNEKDEVAASDAAASDRFGDDVAISGNYAIVGAPFEDQSPSNVTVANAGSAYIYERDGSGNWNQVAKLVATNRVVDGNFGSAVDIYGDYAVVGAPNEDTLGFNQAGAVYVYQRISGTWTLVKRLIAPVLTTDDVFGNSVAIDQELQIVVGSKNEDHNSAGTGALTNAGAAYVYPYSSGSWGSPYKIVPTDRAAGDNFGWAVDIDANYVIISAMNDDGAVADMGSAYIFTRNPGNLWIQEHKFSEEPYSLQGYGCAVSLYNGTAVVGAMNRDVNAYEDQEGMAYIYRLAPFYDLTQSLSQPIPFAGGHFGQDVSLSGNYLVIGANRVNSSGPNNGGTYIYERCYDSVDPWNLLEMITYSGVGYGKSVDIAGGYIISGAPIKNTSAGSAYFIESCGVGALRNASVNNDNAQETSSVNGSNALTCYPNPATDHMNITLERMPEGNIGMAIIDINGRTISTTNLTIENTIIDVSTLTPGIYFIQVTFEGGQMTEKFVKQ